MGGSAEGTPAARGKRSTSREIDAMLKDVQKTDPPPPPKKSEPAALPPLTASDISKAMAAVKTRANECGRSVGQKGMAELKLTVGKDGRVSNVTIAGRSAGSPLGDCVAKAARAASFPPNAGLKFDYRIDVR
jgi:TonB family protein